MEQLKNMLKDSSLKALEKKYSMMMQSTAEGADGKDYPDVTINLK